MAWLSGYVASVSCRAGHVYSAVYQLVQKAVAWLCRGVASAKHHVVQVVTSVLVKPPAYVLSVGHDAVVNVFETPMLRDLLFMSGNVFVAIVYYLRRPPPIPPEPHKLDVCIDPAMIEFLDSTGKRYTYDRTLPELGSRMRKRWYVVKKTESVEERQVYRLVTVAPVSQSCPLQLIKHQKQINRLMEVVRLHGHPYIHPIDEVVYLGRSQMLAIVQPLIDHGSLKDKIYKVGTPTWKLEWSSKYAHRSKGLPPEDVARYGRQILEGILFLYGLGFPALGHVQSGNVFIVDGNCRLGGYENTIVGYKTRLFRICKDHLKKLDVILFGHLVFEMSAGYELTQIRPSEKEYETVHEDVRPILQYIFKEGFPHSIAEIAGHQFFSQVEVESNTKLVKLSADLVESKKVVLEEVRKDKPRTQKAVASREEKVKSSSRSLAGVLSYLKSAGKKKE